MLPFSGFGPIDRGERKALVIAAVFCCVFIFILAVARPRPRPTRVRIAANDWMVDPPPPRPYRAPEMSMGDSLQRFRVKSENFEQTDFNFFSYGPYRLSDGTNINLRLAQGAFEVQLPNGGDWFNLKDVYYTDLTGDGKPEAIVWLAHVTCGASCDGGTNMFYIYTERNGKLKPIWQYETGSYADGCGLQAFTAGGTRIVVELFGRCEKSGIDNSGTQKFMSKDLTYILFEYNGQRFVQKSTEFLDSAATDTKNYEPGIRIY